MPHFLLLTFRPSYFDDTYTTTYSVIAQSTQRVFVTIPLITKDIKRVYTPWSLGSL